MQPKVLLYQVSVAGLSEVPTCPRPDQPQAVALGVMTNEYCWHPVNPSDAKVALTFLAMHDVSQLAMVYGRGPFVLPPRLFRPYEFS